MKIKAFWASRLGLIASLSVCTLCVCLAVLRAAAPSGKAAPQAIPSRSPMPAPTAVEQAAATARGDVLAPYSPDALVWSETLGLYQTHAGVDLAMSLGEAVTAGADGVIARAWRDDRLGLCARIDCADGLSITYANLMTLSLAEEGARVAADDVIGSVGETAAFEKAMPPHLHVEAARDGENIDPSPWLP